jgi:hypothetical protein
MLSFEGGGLFNTKSEERGKTVREKEKLKRLLR